MSHIRRFDHVGITVADLDTVTAFFVELGLEVEGRTFVEGEIVDTVIGIPGSRSHIVTLRPLGGGPRLELSSFVRPDHEPGSPTAMANELGLRNVAFEVHDLHATVDRLAADGYGPAGGIGQHENIWHMAYVRGPEGITVSRAQRIGCHAPAPQLLGATRCLRLGDRLGSISPHGRTRRIQKTSLEGYMRTPALAPRRKSWPDRASAQPPRKHHAGDRFWA